MSYSVGNMAFRNVALDHSASVNRYNIVPSISGQYDCYPNVFEIIVWC